MLQAHHVAGAVVDHFGGQAICVRAAVVDGMDHARIVVAERRGLLDRRNRRHRFIRRHVHGIGRVAGESCQAAGLGRVGRYEDGLNVIHMFPLGLEFRCCPAWD